MANVRYKKQHGKIRKDAFAVIDNASAKRLEAQGIVEILDPKKGLRELHRNFHRAPMNKSVTSSQYDQKSIEESNDHSRVPKKKD